MCIKATVFVFFLSFFDRLVSANLDVLDVNLLDEVTSTEQPSPNVSDDDDDVRTVSIAWMARPPYLFHENLPGEKQRHDPLNAAKSENETKDDDRASGGQADPNMKGIFQEIVRKGLQICCQISLQNIWYTTEAKNLQQLDQSIVNESADLFMPVYGSGNDYGGREYVEVLKSPGVVFIVNKEQTVEQSRKRVWQAMKETWPVVVITLSLAGIAGLLIWGLDNSGNPEQFPRSFTRGVMEGIWWAFVSMTTVGYGDKVPRSLLGRLFGILWILTGVVLCSFFTATFTSALTSSSLQQRSSLLGVKVAVIADSPAYDYALKQAANVRDYPDFYKMYEALMGNREVEGILADIYTASYYMNNISDPRLAVSMFFSTQRSIGFAVQTELEEYIRREDCEVYNRQEDCKVTCLRNLFKYRQQDIKKIVIRHTQAYHTETLNRKLKDKDADIIVMLLDGDSPGFRIVLYALFIPFGLLLFAGFIYDLFLSKVMTQKLTSLRGFTSDSIIMALRSRPLSKQNR